MSLGNVSVELFEVSNHEAAIFNLRHTNNPIHYIEPGKYDKFMAGEELVNDKDHFRGGKGGSTSTGFCFTTDTTQTAWRYLKGIVTADVCMVLNMQASAVKQSEGVYVDYSGGADGMKRYLKQEYCANRYSNKTAKLIRVFRAEDFATKAELEAISMLKNFGLIQ